MHKKAIILFGASVGGQRALDWYQQQADTTVLAIADNDVSRQGTFIDQVPVISPAQIQQYDWSQIVICSMYFQPIRQQLIGQYGIVASAISVVSATVLKGLQPLQRGELYHQARQLMLQLTSVLSKEAIPYYIDHGTLLGLVREGDLLPWDNDVDIAIDAEYAQAAFAVLQSFLAADAQHSTPWQVSYQSGTFDTAEGPLQGWRIIKVTLQSAGMSAEHLVDFIIKHKVGPLRYWLVGTTTLQAPDELTSARVSLDYQGHTLTIPASTQQYLTLLYGDNWHIPKQDWSHANYSNITE